MTPRRAAPRIARGAGAGLIAVAVLAATGCSGLRPGREGGGATEPGSWESPELASLEDAREAASEALPVIQFLDDNRHNVAETLGFRTGETFDEIVLSPKPPLPVFTISVKDLRYSQVWEETKKEMEEARKRMTPKQRGEYDRLTEEAESLSEVFSRLESEEGAEAAFFFISLELMFGGNLERVLEKLRLQEPAEWVFQATKERDERHLTPIVVRAVPDPDDPGSARWRLFKVGQAPLARTLRCNPDALYILDIPGLYLSFVAKPPRPPGFRDTDLPEECPRPRDEEPLTLGEEPDCLLGLEIQELRPPDDQLPSADDCLVAIHDFPDLYGIEAGQRGLFKGWILMLEILAKTWQGSTEDTLRRWRESSGS